MLLTTATSLKGTKGFERPLGTFQEPLGEEADFCGQVDKGLQG